MPHINITVKGAALLAAIDSGICARTETGCDTKSFDSFWTCFMSNLSESPDKELNDLRKVIENKSGRRSGKRRKNSELIFISLLGGVSGALIVQILFRLGSFIF